MKTPKFKKRTSWLQDVRHFLGQKLIRPYQTIKKWTVSSGGWGGGHFRSFWKFDEAVEYAQKQTGLFIDIKNEITGEGVRVRDNPDKVKPPIRYA